MTSPQIPSQSSFLITVLPESTGAPRPRLLLVARRGEPRLVNYAAQADDLMNTELPRVSSCLADAGTRFSENKLEEACASLAQASAILEALLVTLVPPASSALPEVETAAKAEDTPENPPRAVAAAA